MSSQKHKRKGGFWKRVKKSLFEVFPRSEIDTMLYNERAFLDKNAPKALTRLKRLGWTVLSTDERVFFYGFRIQKGEHIHKVSVREALLMK